MARTHQLGYALDSRWYSIGEFTATMRAGLASLTHAQVNAAIRTHLSADDLSVVMVAGDAAALREQLLAVGPTAITYDADKPPELLAEDRIVGAEPLGLRPESVRITPVDQVFAG